MPSLGIRAELGPAVSNFAVAVAALVGSLTAGGALPLPALVAPVLGLVLVYAGMGFGAWAALHLEGAICGLVRPRLDRLVTSGPFRIVRHPVYLGTTVALCGVAIVARSWLGLAITLVLVLASAVFRARREDEALLEAFGDEWRAYAARTPFLIPGNRPR